MSQPKRICVVGIPHFYDLKFIVTRCNDLLKTMTPLPVIVTRGDSWAKENGKMVGCDYLIGKWATGRGVGSILETRHVGGIPDGKDERERDKNMVVSCTHLIAFSDGRDEDVLRIIKFAKMYGLKTKTFKV